MTTHRGPRVEFLLPLLFAAAGCGGGGREDLGPSYEGKPVALHAKDLQLLRDPVLQRARLGEWVARPDLGAPVLAAVLRGEDARLAEQAGYALATDAERRPDPVAPTDDLLAALEAALRRPEGGARAAAAPALALLSPPSRKDTARSLAGLLKDQDYRVRREALRAFRLLGKPGEGWIPEIRELLRAGPSESLEAALTLAALGDSAKETLDRLAAAAADTMHPAEAVRAVQALGGLGSAARAAAPALGKPIANRSAGKLAPDYADALGLVGGADPAALGALEKMLADRDTEMRLSAVLALVRLGKKEAPLGDLAAAAGLPSGMPRVRAAEARVLLGRDEEAAFADLVACMEARAPDLAVAAVRALGRLAAVRVLPESVRGALKAASAKGPLALRRAAAASLAVPAPR